MAGVRADHMDDADEAGRSKGDRRGAAYDLDSVEVDEVQSRRGGIERPSIRNAVHHQQVGVHFGEALHGDDAACRTRIASGQHFYARCRTKRRAEIERPARARVVARNHRIRDRRGQLPLGRPSGGDDDCLLRRRD